MFALDRLLEQSPTGNQDEHGQGREPSKRQGQPPLDSCQQQDRRQRQARGGDEIRQDMGKYGFDTIDVVGEQVGHVPHLPSSQHADRHVADSLEQPLSIAFDDLVTVQKATFLAAEGESPLHEEQAS